MTRSSNEGHWFANVPSRRRKCGGSVNSKGCALRRFAVELDPDSGAGRRQETAALKRAAGPGRHRAASCRAPWQFLDREVRDRHAELHADRGGNRGRAGCGDELDVVRLRPAGDLLRLGQSRRRCRGRSGRSRSAPPRSPGGTPTCWRTARPRRAARSMCCRNLPYGSVLSRAERVLDEERAILLDRAAEPDRVRRIEAGVDVEQELDVGTQSLAHGRDGAQQLARRGPRLDHVVAAERRQPEEPPSIGHGPSTLLDQGVERAGGADGERTPRSGRCG